MNYFNHQNIQLAYGAVYDQDLCESMEDLGLIGEYNHLNKSERLDKTTSSSEDYSSLNEEELYNLIIEYLIQEGFADTLGSAEIILENMSDEWLEEIIEEREPGVKPYRANPTQAEIRERQTKGKKKDEGSGWKNRSHIKSENPLITTNPGDPEEARETLKKTLPDGGRIMGPGFFPSRPADRVASITSSFTRGDNPGGGDPQATRMPGEKKPRRVIPSRLDRKKG